MRERKNQESMTLIREIKSVAVCHHVAVVCSKCKAHFCPYCRDVSDWKIIDCENASEFCRKCWRAKSLKNGREFGILDAKAS